MTGQTFNGKSKRIRKYISFHPQNDATILNYLDDQTAEGKDFSAVVRELLLQMITIKEFGLPGQEAPTLAPTGVPARSEVIPTSAPTDVLTRLDDPFSELKDAYG